MRHDKEMEEQVMTQWEPFFTKMGIDGLRVFNRGKRGVILTGYSEGAKVGIKVKRPSSEAVNRILIEAFNLNKVNDLGIGPTLLRADKHEGNYFLVYEFVEGQLIGDFVEKCTDKMWRDVAKKLLEMMFVLDCAGLTKEEMHSPLKHVLIHGENVELIDFERMHHDTCPKNVTQCVQFLTSGVVRGFRSGVPRVQALQDDLQRYKQALELYHQKKIQKDSLESAFHVLLRQFY